MLTPELEKAYRRTIYRVSADGVEIELRVGGRSPELDALVDQSGVACWVLVTAFNPGSVIASREENERRNRELEYLLVKSGHKLFRSSAIDPYGSWPEEEGFVAIGMDINDGELAARVYGQNAILTGVKGGEVELHFVSY